MSRRHRNAFDSSSFPSVGWLFADLLLALAMLFLIANTVGSPPHHKQIPTPVPTRVVLGVTPTPIPTPTPLPRLELQFHEFKITVDSNGLINDSQSAIDNVKNQVRAQNVLRDRSVGLVIAYGGAPTDSDIGNAQTIAEKVYTILKLLGKEKFAFDRASYYSTLYLLGGQSNMVTIDVYLFAQ